MKRLFAAVLVSLTLLSLSAYAKGPRYSGKTHTTSHGGTYVGGSGGASHKGGKYVSPTGRHEYGTHKP